MANTLRNMPRYIRNTDAFGWQGADNPDGPWRSIAPPQSGTPWQQGNTPMDDLRQTSAEVSGVEVLSQQFSSAAQEVLDAVHGIIPDTSIAEVLAIAAALRAAADQVPVPVSIDDLPEQDARWYRLGVVNFRQALRTIAAELEGHHA